MRQPRACTVCGAECVGRGRSALTCSAACSAERGRQRSRDYQRALSAERPLARPGACSECGAPTPPATRPIVTCGAACYTVRRRRLYQERTRSPRPPATREELLEEQRRRAEAEVQAAGARPVPAPLSSDPDRQLWCRRYDSCLDLAVHSGWEGFTCRDCPIRGTCDVSPEEREREATRSASSALLAIDEATYARPRSP